MAEPAALRHERPAVLGGRLSGWRRPAAADRRAIADVDRFRSTHHGVVSATDECRDRIETRASDRRAA